ncbi:MAG: hypothetical protein Roseis2KO_13140 [Roseivirga sp.]
MSEEAEEGGSFNIVTWIFVVLFLVFNWGAMDWVDAATLIHDREELFIEKIIYTLPLNLSFAFAFILASSVKRYNNWHFGINAFFFMVITDVFNRKGWLKPPVKIERSGLWPTRTYHLVLEYFDHFGTFDFLSALLIALYFTYYWHFEIMEKKV